LHGLCLLEKIAGRSNYLALLLEHPQALQRMLDYGARSDWIAQQLQQQPALLDELIDPASLHNLPHSTTGYIDQALSLSQQTHSSVEQQLSLLQQWRQSCSLRIAANGLFKYLDTSAVQRHLSHLAEACLQAISNISQQQLQSPMAPTIIAYGTLGAGEMHYGSDLDLVFLYPKNLSEPEHSERSVTRHAQKIIHLLTTIGPHNRLYEIDTRLRPNGQSGILVSNINSFKNYQLNQAWVWEWQALTRARCVIGEPTMHRHFESIRRRILQPARDATMLRTAITDMFAHVHTAFQSDPTAIQRLRLQFLTQYWLLSHALPSTAIPCHLPTQAEWLAEHFPALKMDALLVAKTYHELHAYLQQQQLDETTNISPPATDHIVALWEKYFLG